MKYLLAFVLFVVGIGVAAPPLYYSHTLTLIPACIMAGCIGFGSYLFDPTGFLEWSADARKSATTWFHRGDT